MEKKPSRRNCGEKPGDDPRIHNGAPDVPTDDQNNHVDGPDGPNLGDDVFTGTGDWHEHNDNPFDWTDVPDPPETDEEPERDPEPQPERPEPEHPLAEPESALQVEHTDYVPMTPALNNAMSFYEHSAAGVKVV